MDAFASLALQSVLAVEAVLFGVFGFLYSVYAMYSSAATLENPARAPICNKLKILCRWLAAIITLDTILAIYALCILGPTGAPGYILSAGLGLSVLLMAGISLWLAFLAME